MNEYWFFREGKKQQLADQIVVFVQAMVREYLDHPEKLPRALHHWISEASVIAKQYDEIRDSERGEVG